MRAAVPCTGRAYGESTIFASARSAWHREKVQTLSRFVVVHLLILVGLGCASAHPSRPLTPTGVVLSAAEPESEQPPDEQEPASGPASQPAPSPEQRLSQLRQRLELELAAPELERARVSLVVAPAAGGDPLFELEPEAHRVPASNAKLLTSVAALKTLPGRYGFVTEYSVRGSRLHIWGNGDPALRGGELLALGRQLRARGLTRVSGVVVDDSYFDRRARLAPGFQSFGEGAYYRPTSGALSVNGNSVTVKVTAPRDRKRPRVDVYPPSDYVKVRKLVRYLPRRSKKHTAIRVSVRPRGSIMWVTVSGVMRRGERSWRTRRAVYDPGLATGWAVRRALVKAGVQVSGSVWRGRRPTGARLLLRRARPLGAVLARVNTHSDNLAAEHLVRAMGSLDKSQRAGSWLVGLAALHKALEELGLSDFWLGNGSGLHRKSWVTARTMVALLQKVFGDERLKHALLPTLAVAGQSGTLAPRMRGSAAQGVLHAKTGTLAGALALSGFVDPEGASPLVFSLLVNGRSDHAVRDRMDRIGVLLARYATDRPLTEAPTTEPATQPASQPASAPTSQPTDEDEGEAL